MVASGQRVIDNAKDIYLVVVNDTANVRSPLQIDEYIPLIIIIIISSDSITFVVKCFKIPCQQNDSGKDNPILANDINRVIPGKVTIRVDEEEENGSKTVFWVKKVFLAKTTLFFWLRQPYSG